MSETPEREGHPDEIVTKCHTFSLWVKFEGPTENTIEVSLVPGRLYELRPGGALFNEHGSYLGNFEFRHFGPLSEGGSSAADSSVGERQGRQPPSLSGSDEGVTHA